MTSGPAATVERLQARVRPRTIDGISALLLPYRADGRPDWDTYAACVAQTVAAGVRPALNMDTGYVHLLTPEERAEALRVVAGALAGSTGGGQANGALAAGAFVAGAFVEDRASANASPDELISRYCAEAEPIRAGGGLPILFQCTALKRLSDADVVDVYRGVSERVGPILGFELGEMFAPFGQIYAFELFAELLQIPGLIGLKHSSLDRRLEWQRLELRDRVRPDFTVYTGNDLAIDMVCYGSDYLLGLSAFAPEAFGLRDRLWAAGDARFYPLNDVLQYLGAFAFRAPVPAYKHSAAQFLHLRGRIPGSATHPDSPTRPDSDLPILAAIAERLDAALADARQALS